MAAKQQSAPSAWLVKSEPDVYSLSDLQRDGTTVWDGVRNFEARNNLRAMKKGDLVLYYHTGSEKQVVGIAKVVREAYPDPSAKEGDWSVVELGSAKPLRKPVTLSQLKAEPALSDFALLRKGRLSVVPVGARELEHILTLSGTKR